MTGHLPTDDAHAVRPYSQVRVGSTDRAARAVARATWVCESGGGGRKRRLVVDATGLAACFERRDIEVKVDSGDEAVAVEICG